MIASLVRAGVAARLAAVMLAFGVPPLRPPLHPPLPVVAPAAVASTRATRATQADTQPRAAVPWRVGESLTFDVKFGRLKVGTGSMEVVGVEMVRGRETYHTRFGVRGGTFFYKVNDILESWMDTRTLASRRFVKDFAEGGRDRESRFEIFPERRAFQEFGHPDEEESVADPLDDGSFLYFIRTVPLKVGETYDFARYFKPDRNPVRVRVVRKERITVPAGTFDAVVIQPTIKTRGIFSEGGRAEVWVSDDSTRTMLQVKSQLSFGSLNLYLRSRTLGTGG